MTRPVYAALLAGGQGTRFWPLSRAARPKQFLSLGDRKSLLRRTWERIRLAVDAENILIVAAPRYRPDVEREIPELPAGNFLEEPEPRDTAPAVGLAALAVESRAADGVLVVAPTDHRVEESGAFVDALSAAIRRAGRGGIVTLGVRPDRPATSYGYIETEGEPDEDGAYRVRSFVEKPDAATAGRYLAAGAYLWNAGLFVFGVGSFFEEVARSAPDLHAGLERLRAALGEGEPAALAATWNAMPKTSLDYALIERARDLRSVPLAAGWSDVGGWDAAAELLARDGEGNASAGAEALFVGSSGVTIFGAGEQGAAGRLVAVVGADDLVIVESGEALLVCRRGRGDEVREAVRRLRRAGRDDLL